MAGGLRDGYDYQEGQRDYHDTLPSYDDEGRG
jgi:hypothetical protein